ncbi:MAG TPA: hypothetical protein VFF21_09550, partial [Flavobacteriaceae bacterium]|nr:hypothetical protein [Flavobacteriaceae bacterium]
GTSLSRDLYQDYVNQFSGVPFHIAHGATGGSQLYNGGVISSDATKPAIAVYEKHELIYYVTYYDPAVFGNLSISADGILTYDIIGTGTPQATMNIVFVIK